jgi:hypothetical protein
VNGKRLRWKEGEEESGLHRGVSGLSGVFAGLALAETLTQLGSKVGHTPVLFLKPSRWRRGALQSLSLSCALAHTSMRSSTSNCLRTVHLSRCTSCLVRPFFSAHIPGRLTHTVADDAFTDIQ